MDINKLYLGDCFELFKTITNESIDMILTDPPYGIGYRCGWRDDNGKHKHRYISNDDNLDWLPQFASECYRVLKSGTVFYCFTSDKLIDVFKNEIEKHFEFIQILVWDKKATGMGGRETTFAPQGEFILLFKKGKRYLTGHRHSHIIKCNRTHNKLHPTEKPIPLIECLITSFSKEGEVILDPFAGSATTAIAAINSKRNWICIEIDDEYYHIALNRIDQRLKFKQEQMNNKVAT